MKLISVIIIILFQFNLTSQKVITNGSMTIGNDTVSQGSPGTVRWTGSDFQGWTGLEWISLIADSYIKDIDGNQYNTIKIGSQIWMGKNLKTTKYYDGTPIPFGNNTTTWANANVNSLPAYCWYNDDSLNYSNPYGALYNFYSISETYNGGKNVCPLGWHIPSKIELDTLQLFLGGQTIAGKKLKEMGVAHWVTPNTGANNQSGYSAVGAGRRGPSGTFAANKSTNYIRSSTISTPPNAFYSYLNSIDTNFIVADWNMGIGMSVRCIKD